eukprot:7340767-Ditylum_brightwellii.AAC.1
MSAAAMQYPSLKEPSHTAAALPSVIAKAIYSLPSSQCPLSDVLGSGGDVSFRDQPVIMMSLLLLIEQTALPTFIG